MNKLWIKCCIKKREYLTNLVFSEQAVLHIFRLPQEMIVSTGLSKPCQICRKTEITYSNQVQMVGFVE